MHNTHWKADLKLRFCTSNDQTVMRENTHSGPLRVQRTFNPEDGSKHVYILHPPGGYVAGDVIDIKVIAEDCTHVVVTSPGAAKFYRCEQNHPLPQTQTLVLTADDHSLLEWLPQETILFKDANAQLTSDIHLAARADFIGWEINCLGRTASGEDFGQGRMHQTTRLFREGTLVHRERLAIIPEDNLQTAAWGLNNEPVFGTLIAAFSHQTEQQQDKTLYDHQDQIQQAVDVLREHFASGDNEACWSVTAKTGIILVRFMGRHSETCKNGFTAAREILLKHFKHIDANRPRIWAT